MKSDVIIVGAGPSGIFTALELLDKQPDKNILIFEKGNPIGLRKCPKRLTGKCAHCKPCSITTGFAGAGAFSDGKLSLAPEVGGELPEHIGYDETVDLIKYTDDIYLKYGADPHIYGIDNKEAIERIRKKAIRSNLKLVECPVRHMGTEVGEKIYKKIQDYLMNQDNIQIFFNTSVEDIIIENNEALGVSTQLGDYFADRIIVSVGREGSDWLEQLCHKHNIERTVGKVDIGVRVETRNEVMEEINDALYEGKLIYYTPTFDDKVRTFCSNPGGEVTSEYYDELAVVNGHSYKDSSAKTDNTNFALLVSKGFTEPFNSPIEYGKHIANLGNMITGNKILVQRYGDFIRGRRTTEERLYRNNITPTLKDAIPGDLGLVLPYRIMTDIIEMLEALDKVTPGLTSDETLLHGIEVKFYSNKIKVDDHFQTSVKNLFTLGDGAGITRGLIQASANGVYVARHLFDE